MQSRKMMSLARRLSLTFGLGALLSAPAFGDAPSTAADTFPALSLLVAPALPAGEVGMTLQEVPAVPQLQRTIDLTAHNDQLWERLRQGFAMNNLSDDLTLHYQQWYQNRPDALRRMVDRARPYLHHIVEELEARGMPTELALLPMVESSFNPLAYSRAHASGLWQFIPATGKRFNLEQNWWQDQRRDVLASTSAALDYLQTIYDMHGDWHLALASYNWGEGAVKRAIERNQSRGLPTDYASLVMPPETRHYVPKLQALKNIFGNPSLVARLGLPEIPNQAYFATLESPRPMDVKLAARLAGMSVQEFVRLNPAHNRPVIMPDSPLVVPADKLDRFRANLAEHRAPLTEWHAYTLKQAERIDRIAERFDIKLADLLQANGLSSNLRLGAGSTLLVPAGKDVQELGEYLNNSSTFNQIIEPEPVIRPLAKGKRGKGKDDDRLARLLGDKPGKGKVVAQGKADKLAARDGKRAASQGKQASRSESRAAGAKQAAVAKAPAAKSSVTRTASAKSAASSAKKEASAAPPAPSKVARSGGGRRS